MMRSGGILCCSNASVFLASEKLKLKEFSERGALLMATQNASANLEFEINHLLHNNTEATEYFRVS